MTETVGEVVARLDDISWSQRTAYVRDQRVLAEVGDVVPN